MKINYEFADGNRVEIEVDAKWAEVVIELDRVEYNNEQKETRRHISLDCFSDKSKVYCQPEGNLFIRIAGKSFDISDPRIMDAINMLPEKQRELVIHVYFKKASIRKYAQDKGLDEKYLSVIHRRSLEKIRRILEKNSQK